MRSVFKLHHSLRESKGPKDRNPVAQLLPVSDFTTARKKVKRAEEKDEVRNRVQRF